MVLRYSEIKDNPIKVLDWTSLLPEEFEELVVRFEQEYQSYLSRWRLDGKPRTARRYTTYSNCPLPTAEDRLLFILVYLKTHPLQIVQGELFGIAQCKASQWIHVLLQVLGNTLREMGESPARSVVELAKQLGVSVEEAGKFVEEAKVESEADQESGTEKSEGGKTESPLFVRMSPNGESGGPWIRLNKKAVIAARKNATR